MSTAVSDPVTAADSTGNKASTQTVIKSDLLEKRYASTYNVKHTNPLNKNSIG